MVSEGLPDDTSLSVASTSGLGHFLGDNGSGDMLLGMLFDVFGLELLRADAMSFANSEECAFFKGNKLSRPGMNTTESDLPHVRLH
jgi:hypothetical protein